MGKRGIVIGFAEPSLLSRLPMFFLLADRIELPGLRLFCMKSLIKNNNTMAKWKFEEQTGQEQGPNNATAEHFKSRDAFSSLVRESIQNSLDAYLDSSKPVKVEYAFGHLVEDDLSNSIRKIEEHVHSCLNSYPESSTYQRMVEYLNQHAMDHISYLRVSDYNTKGMDYTPDTKCGFHSFLQSIGDSHKDGEGAGGSYGFGKAAYYELSNARTILVSTKTDKGKVAFQGCYMLCTHKMDDGKKYCSSGFYDLGDKKPIQDEDSIPEELRRSECGSDIYLLYVDADRNKLSQYQETLIKSVLINFWLSVYESKLEVTFDWEDNGEPEVIISKETLEKLMLAYFPSMADDQGRYDNPRPYYEAVKNAVAFDPKSEEKHDCVYFEEQNLHNKFGHVRFYLKRNIGTRDRYLRMRKPLMVIDGQNMNGQRGISGVLVCDGIANNYLRRAEPPAHDNWDKERVRSYKNQYGSDEEKAFRAIEALTIWCRDNVKAFFASKNATETEVEGLDNYLYATEETPQQGEGKAVNGIQTDLFSNFETGEHHIKPNGPELVRPTSPVIKTGQVTISITQQKGVEHGGDMGVGRTGNSKGNEQGGEHTSSPKITPRLPKEDKETKLQQQIKHVTFRSSARFEDDGLAYHLVIYTKEDLQDATIFISTMGEISFEEIPIIWADQGEVRENANAIFGVELKKDVPNRVAFKFEDNIKHIISLTVYVTK